MNHPTNVTELITKTDQSAFNCKRALLRTEENMEAAAELLSTKDFIITDKSVKLDSMTISSLGDNISDYTIGERIPYDANYRLTNVGVSSNVASSNLTSKVLSYDGTVKLTARGIGNASQSQIFFYRSNLDLSPEYTRHRTPYPSYSELALKKDGRNVTLAVRGNNINVIAVRHDSFAPIVKIEARGSGNNDLLAAKADGVGVEWVPASNYSSRCEWYAERIYRIEKVPGFTQGIEFFSAKTMSKMPYMWNCTSYTLTDGPVHHTWLYTCELLYLACYGDDAFNNASNVQLYGNMYGALYSSSAYDGKFHPGIDINAGYGSVIRTPISGTVVHVGEEDPNTHLNFGRITILDDDGLYYNFLHLSGFAVAKNKYVQAGDIIGYEGNTGLNQTGHNGSHLHFEVSSVNTYSPISASSFSPLGNTYYPNDIYNRI